VKRGEFRGKPKGGGQGEGVLWEPRGNIPGMAGNILMLEDNGERLEHFAAVLAEMDRGLTFVHWRDARRMIRECGAYLPSCRLICLDHDLDAVPGEGDPGDGLEVARYLAGVQPGCPVLIHSSNGDGARRMTGELELARWRVFTILPFGEGWVERYWRRKVEGLLGDTRP
jgi:hypothetical protein